MGAIVFLQEQGGHIEFEYDRERMYAVCERGTSVPLWQETLAYVPIKRCSCSNPQCKAQERQFDPQEVVGCPAQPEITDSDTQPYAGRFTCWVNVYLFSKEEVDAACPQGFVPAIGTMDEDVFSVHEFLNTRELKG